MDQSRSQRERGTVPSASLIFIGVESPARDPRFNSA
jgi:hypothetical protein